MKHARLMNRVNALRELREAFEDCRESALVVRCNPSMRRGRAIPGDVIVRGLHCPEPGQKLDPVHELHRQKPAVVRVLELVQLDEVAMMNIGERAKLTLEAQNIDRIHARELLERDLLACLAVQGRVHDASATFAEPANQLIARCFESWLRASSGHECSHPCYLIAALGCRLEPATSAEHLILR